MSNTSSVDLSGLEKAVSELIPFSRRTVTQVTNQVGLNVWGRFMNNIPQADKAEIRQELGEIARALRTTKKGRLVRGKRIYSNSARTASAPLAALILNARRGRKGEKGLYGSEMTKKIRALVGSKTGSSGFGRVGNVPGIKTLAGVLPRTFIIARMSGIRVVGQPKGEAIAARESFTPLVTLINSVKSIHKFGTQPLIDAIAAEEREIYRHIEEDFAPAVERFNRN